VTLAGAIAEIDTTAVLTRNYRPIDNPDVEIGASTCVMMVAITAAPTPTQLGLHPMRSQHIGPNIDTPMRNTIARDSPGCGQR
jgi:hypothetical protein